MSRIQVGFSQFKKAFETHWENGRKETGPSYNLLKFYSVECGLKSMYIHENDRFHRMTSEQMPADHSHRLDQWIKELNIPASRISPPPRFRIRQSSRDESPRDIEKIHEAWRYGVVIEPNDETSILRWLEVVSNWIREGLKEA